MKIFKYNRDKICNTEENENENDKNNNEKDNRSEEEGDINKKISKEGKVTLQKG